jgi:hypothetical protein
MRAFCLLGLACLFSLPMACANRGGASDGGDDQGDSDTRGGDDKDDGDDRGEDEGLPDSECGNGEKELSEQCDGDDLGGLTCQDIGWYAGDLSCDEKCGFDEKGCTDPPPGEEPECGNGEKEPGEICDTDDLGGLTCEDFGLGDGDGGLACSGDACELDFSGCRELDPDDKGDWGENCGNGQIDPGEHCDGDLIEVTCEDLGFEGGIVGCKDCFADTSRCE